MSQDTQSTNILRLGVAHLCVELECSHNQLAEKLEQRYQKFISKDSEIIFKAKINWVGTDREDEFLDVEPQFYDGGFLDFEAEGYQGFIDEKNFYGNLKLSSSHPIANIDYFVRTIFAILAYSAGGVLLHTAGIVRDGFAYLFFGHSGSGKTTVCKVSQDDYAILNDDLVLLLPFENGWQAHGTPFWNPTQVQPNPLNAPVRKMYLLTQAKRVAVYPLPAGQALAVLIANVPVIPRDPARNPLLLDRLANIQQTISISELHFLPDNSFWDVIHT